MKIYDAHQDIAGNIQIVTKKNFFKENHLHEGVGAPGFQTMNQVDYPRLIKGGVRLVFATIFAKTKKQAVDQYRIYANITKKSKGKIKLIKSGNDLKKIGSSIGFLLNMEGSGPLEDIADLEYFYKLGLRSIGIVWRGENKYVKNDSLTESGELLLRKIESKKIILDLAHASEKLFWEISKKYKKPFIVSHSACRDLCDNQRNLSNKQILEIHKRKGIIGICSVNKLIGGDSLSDMVKHIKHAVKKSSISNVCIGSDFDGMVNPALTALKELEDVSQFPNLVEKLKKTFKNEAKKIAYQNLDSFIKNSI